MDGKYLRDYPLDYHLEHTHTPEFVHLSQNKTPEGWQDSYDGPLIKVQSQFWTQALPA